MSYNPESSQGLPKDSIWKRKFGRRDFLRSAGTAAGVMAAAPALRAFAAAERMVGAAGPEAAETATDIDWSNLPLVENEPPSTGTVEVAEPLAGILPETRVITGDTLNLRAVDNVNNVVTALSHSSLVRILPEPDGAALPTKSGYELSLADQLILNEEGKLVVGEKGRLAETLTSPVTADAEGNITFYDPNQKKEVTVPVTTPLVRYEQRDLVMPDVSLVRTSESLAQSFNASSIGGGEGEAEAKSQSAWGGKKLSVFQRAVAFAAIDEGLKNPDDRTGFSEVDSILGEGTELFQLSVHHAEDHLDVISRMGIGTAEDKFVITRISHNGAENTEGMNGFTMSVDGVGIATWEALVEAYGENAVAYAENATALQGTQDDIDAIAALEKSGVFLAGIGENGMVAPKVAAKADTTRVLYERVGGSKGAASYRAVLFSEDTETKEEVQTGEAVFMAGENFAEWVTMPEEADMGAYVDVYALVQGLDAAEVRQGLAYEQRQDKDGKTYVVMTHGATPLMVRELGADGQEWEEATPKICGRLSSQPLAVFTSVDGAEPYNSTVYKESYDKFSGLAPSGSFLKTALDDYPSLSRSFTRHVSESGESLRAHTSFFHQVIKQELGEQATREQVDAFVNSHIESIFDTLDAFKENLPHIEVIYANEPKWKSGGNSGWEASPLYSAYGDQWPVEIFVRLYQAAQERGYKLGEQISFMHNDYGVDIDSPNESYSKADMVRDDIAKVRTQIAARLGIDVNDVPLVVGLQGWGAFGAEATNRNWLTNGSSLISMPREQAVELVSTNVRQFADVVDPSGLEDPVSMTEIGTYGATEDEQAEYVSRLVAGLKRSGRANSVGFWTPLRDPRMKQGDDLSLFDIKQTVGKQEADGTTSVVGYLPRKSYYALNTALIND